MNRPAGSDTTTEGIRVIAEATFLPEDSEPEQHQFVYAYRIRMKNEGTRRARLKSRHWVILDADNNREDVRGPGVVGKHPDLKPGEEFEYTSGCPLRTRWGTMEGTYLFEREDGTPFEVAVGRFFLVPSVTADLTR
ncbi:MAG: Co2+/Mg2+ efflux protein ApaG [Planctomycetes bacterium]|nr:Co2+/Mg2+ efflux protein ApaG [Planctomycetota bacterium]